MLPFGPQLIGQTEKTLNALLRTVLIDRRLSEPEWVTLRLASQFGEDGTLVDFVRDRTHYPDVPDLISAMERRELIADSRLSARGRMLVATIGREISVLTGPVWADLNPGEVEVATRALNSILERAREVLNSVTSSGIDHATKVP